MVVRIVEIRVEMMRLHEAWKHDRAANARELAILVIDISRYLNVEATMSRDLIDRAALSYFVEL